MHTKFYSWAELAVFCLKPPEVARLFSEFFNESLLCLSLLLTILLPLLSRKRWRAGCVTNASSYPLEGRGKLFPSGVPSGQAGDLPGWNSVPTAGSRQSGDKPQLPRDVPPSLRVLLTLWVLLAGPVDLANHSVREGPRPQPSGLWRRPLHLWAPRSSACDLPLKLY